MSDFSDEGVSDPQKLNMLHKQSIDFSLVVMEKAKFRNYKVLNQDKNIARSSFIEKVNRLIDGCYENYRYRAGGDNDTIFCGVIEKNSKELVGLLLLLRKNIYGAEFSEFGVSIVDETYRGYGIQTMTQREMANYALKLLTEGYPLYSSTRLFTAQSQMQIFRTKMPNSKGKLVTIGYSRGILPYYIFERDENGEFYLEFHMQHDAWMGLEEVVKKTIFLPASAKEFDFHLFNPYYRPDISPVFGYPHYTKENRCEFRIIEPNSYFAPIVNYSTREWEDLVRNCIIIGHEENQTQWKTSKNAKFLFSDHDSPSETIQAIHIEAIEHFTFIEDFSTTMRSINITLQVSDFEYEENLTANVALIDILLRAGFVPSSMHDILLNKKRVRTVLFSLFRDINVQSKFEILSVNKKTFDIFVHDCQMQGLTWTMVVNIVPIETLDNKKSTQTPFFLDTEYVPLPKSTLINGKSKISLPLNHFLQGSPFFHRIMNVLHPYTYNLWFELDPCEKCILDAEFYSSFDQVASQLEAYFASDPGIEQFTICVQCPREHKKFVVRFTRNDTIESLG